MKKLRLLTVAIFALILAAAMAKAQAQTYTVLYNFGSNSPNCPADPGAIAQGRDGNLFSTAMDCDTDGLGTAFRITPTGAVTVLHSFNGTDGLSTRSGLTLATDGNYYGTTYLGGPYSNGTVFKMTAAGTVTTLHNFTGGADGGTPGAPPIEGLDGNFYGVTTSGGSVGSNGTVYKITPLGTFTTLHSFGFTRPDGDLATNGPLVQGTDGYLYGAALYGGSNSCDGLSCGTIFRISYSGEFKTLFNFDGTHGSHPFGGLIQGSDSNFYGTAANGGVGSANFLCTQQAVAGCGVVFKITPTGAFTVLHNFTGSDGANPVDGLVLATDGNFYGTTFQGAEGGFPGWGVLFRIAPAGTFTVLHTFDGSSGAQPRALLQHTNGKLYGHANKGGTAGDGVFYSYFDVGLHPFVRLLPEAANIDTSVGILGQGFIGTSAVSFNGTAATFTVVSDTYLTATVPAGATGGFVTITTPSGTLTSSKKFLVGLPIVPPSVSLTLRSTPYPTPPVQGGLLNYAFKVWNNTSDVAWHEVLSTQVPAGTSFSGLTISGTPGVGSCTHPAVGATGSVICHEGSGMAPGTTWTIRLTVQVTAPTGTVITETATASSDNLGSRTVTVSNTVH